MHQTIGEGRIHVNQLVESMRLANIRCSLTIVNFLTPEKELSVRIMVIIQYENADQAQLIETLIRGARGAVVVSGSLPGLGSSKSIFVDTNGNEIEGQIEYTDDGIPHFVEILEWGYE